MALSLKPEHLKRYKDLAWLLVKYARPEALRRAEAGDPETIPTAEQLADDLEKLGPTFVKLGQLLSTRPDLLPASYIEALARLQDEVEPIPFQDVIDTIEAELGVRVSKVFPDLDPVPLAAASLGQVHRARLRDGREVAIKVQRPNVREQVLTDLAAFEEAVGLIDDHTSIGRQLEFRTMLAEFRTSLIHELDYRREAASLTKLARNLAEFERIVVPLPVDDLTTERVLTMDYVRGRKITAIGPLGRQGIHGAVLAEDLFRSYMQQILVDGFFHADPHPGNVFLTDDGRIALLDLGMTGTMPAALQEKLLQLLLAIAEARADDAVAIAIRVGDPREDYDDAAFRHAITTVVMEQHSGGPQRFEVGRAVIGLAKAAAECGVRVPRELTMLGKTLLSLDQVGWTLDPAFDPNAAVRRNAADILRKRLISSVSLGNIFGSFVDAKELVKALPGRINRILERVAENDIQVKVDAIDEKLLLEGFQKIANRITLGLVLAALIVGAALLMDVPTSFRLFGYPGLPILFFLGAAGGGLLLMFQILVRDVRAKKP